MRAIGYVRVSSGGQEQGTSLDSQRDQVRAFCAEQGHEVIALVSEVRSAGVRAGEVFAWEGRPELMALMARAEQREFEILVVVKYDRLSRDHATLIVLRRLLDRHGVRLVSASEQIDDSPESRLLESTLAGFAEYERSVIQSRMQLGKARRKAEGRHVHGRPPYGFQSSSGRLQIVEVEAAVVKRVFREASDGESATRIARRLNREGVSTRAGSRWSGRGIVALLRNRAYVGERYEVRTAHDAIVSRRLWNRVQMSA